MFKKTTFIEYECKNIKVNVNLNFKKNTLKYESTFEKGKYTIILQYTTNTITVNEEGL